MVHDDGSWSVLRAHADALITKDPDPVCNDSPVRKTISWFFLLRIDASYSLYLSATIFGVLVYIRKAVSPLF